MTKATKIDIDYRIRAAAEQIDAAQAKAIEAATENTTILGLMEAAIDNLYEAIRLHKETTAATDNKPAIATVASK